MKTVALVSGGKDSCFNMMCCVAEGHQLVALANLRPEQKDELDSYMFQTVGHHAIDLYSEAMGLPLYTQVITGSSLSTGRDYTPQQGDEVEDLYALLSRIKEAEGIEAVSVGAILSDYQRVRVENVCQRLGLVALSYLWRRNQEQLLKEMIDCGLRAIIIKVAALGLVPSKHLGMELSEIFPHMLKMKSMYGLNECGEGGEYETFVFDCPIFKKSIVIDETERVIHSDDAFAPVGYLNLRNCRLKEKDWDDTVSLLAKVEQLPLLTSEKWIEQAVQGCDVAELAQGAEGLPDSDCPTQSVQPVSGDSYVSRQSDGVNFQVSGVTAFSSETSDVKELTKQAMDKLIGCVTSLGHSAGDIASVSLYVRDLSCFAAVNSVYKTYFDINPPVRLCIQACLPPNVPLQLDCQGRASPSEDRRTMHVQALSHWAPANIGPYSQAVLTGDKLFLAGIVPLIPASLSVIEGDITVQCSVALKHVQEVMKAMQPGLGLCDCPLVVCFVTHTDHMAVARQTWKKCVQNSSDVITHRELSPRVQYCVVPALPKACLVEWQVFAWTSSTEEEDGEEGELSASASSTQPCEKWTVETSCVCSQTVGETFSCQICLELRNGAAVLQMDSLDAESAVKDLVQEYLRLQGQRSSAQSPPLAKVFYVSRLFDYDQLHKCFQRTLSSLVAENSRPPVVSLVPVVSLDSPRQLMAWCQ
ncbi:diphthine--ammonia ligase isoform X2 [Aplysia californica]|uniref:Diphthine--ammonia ligase n=1 Tax=Aplysia californica TaxID=6500 RepID=A0ABM0JQJ7_APLCA|nr:diphthine--ammonia ligase isoform X2 [Aplysia californica]